jgi:putative DNA methylase
MNDTPLANARCFMETQFPVAKMSVESYKERKANYSQTLTGLGKWWGRKPLVLVRAAILGLLMPASDDPAKDKEIFLKLMTMDQEGLRRRKKSRIPANIIHEYTTRSEREKFFQPNTPSWKSDPEIAYAVMTAVESDQVFEAPPTSLESNVRTGPRKSDTKDRMRRIRQVASDAKSDLDVRVFDRLPYSKKVEYCLRPEQLTDGPSPEAWVVINAHLGTNASSLPELVEELGKLRFGHRPRVGDSFCGAGSVPFEAARIGCDAYGSDLSPVAALLTWAALNIIGGGPEVVDKVRTAQERIYQAVDQQVREWGIEHNELGWRADAFLYCVEVRDPESGWMVPLAPSWVIGEKTHTIARLVPDEVNNRYVIEIHEGVSADEMRRAKESGTVKDSRLVPPGGGQPTSIESIRRNIRMWENDDLVPRPDDIFQERLYCIRWVESFVDANGKERTRRHYRAPTEADLERERKALGLLQDRFHEWQKEGYIPSRTIEPGTKTDEPIRTRGWTHWHHLFTPRQLLIAGVYGAASNAQLLSELGRCGAVMSIGRLCDWNSKLCRWHPHGANEKSEQTFSNQALNTLSNYASRGLLALQNALCGDLKNECVVGPGSATAKDARDINCLADVWATDPPYADAINYHELSEYFLAWYEPCLDTLFPDWYTDSKRVLAVKGNDESFRQSMVDCYRRLVEFMPENGLQIVMFTHQDAAVWADLTLILWAAGLRVTAAWTIATETDSALKSGNYVQGTVILVCRKRVEEASLFLDDISHLVEVEVKRQLDNMLALEDDSDPNFSDADYQLAAYAAALRVLTAQPIEEINPEKELLRERRQGEVSPVEALIREAVHIASNHLVPKGLDDEVWKTLAPTERFYLKGLEVESHGEYRSGVYQELARGFGVPDYSNLLHSGKANQTRLMSAGEMQRRYLSSEGFGQSPLRQALFAVYTSAKSEETRDGLSYLRTELKDYWSIKAKLMEILEYLGRLSYVGTMSHWAKDAKAAQLLAGAIRNDHI